MNTDYGTTEHVATDHEIYARVLIASRDHGLKLPPNQMLIVEDNGNGYVTKHGPILSMNFDLRADADAWTAHVGRGGKFFGWNLSVSANERPYKPTVVTPADRAVVDAAVSDYEPTAEVFTPRVPAGMEYTPADRAPCDVPYIRPMTADGMTYEVVDRCVRPAAHLGDHADVKSHQWPNEYAGPLYKSVTP